MRASDELVWAIPSADGAVAALLLRRLAALRVPPAPGEAPGWPTPDAGPRAAGGLARARWLQRLDEFEELPSPESDA